MDSRTSMSGPTPVEVSAFDKLIVRLPITLQPIPRQQLQRWDSLFPYERRNLLVFLDYLRALNDDGFEALFRPMRELEARMGVARWGFSTAEDTLQNASLLARSEYYQDWRREVARIFDVVNSSSSPQETQRFDNRLVLLIFPEILPLDPETAWHRWGNSGRELKLTEPARGLAESLLFGNAISPGIVGAPADPADFWLIDAGTALRPGTKSGGEAVIWLSYSEIGVLRERLLERLNSISKDMSEADEVRQALEQTDWTPWCTPALARTKTARDFVTALLLSGNGSPIFANSFVEWASSEALRRARPRVLSARFGTRIRPKPFTSLAIFEDQEKMSPMPDVDDPEGSAVDAAMLARYVWLAAARYREYSNASCLCLSERLTTAYLIAPETHPLWGEAGPISPSRLANVVTVWMRQGPGA